MKILSVIFLLTALSFIASGCANAPSVNNEETDAQNQADVKEFSYNDVLNGIDAADDFVQTEHFKNYSPAPVTDSASAVENAAKECTVEHTSAAVFYDEETNMWMVNFYTIGMIGGSEEVYMNSNGETQLIVYGE